MAKPKRKYQVYTAYYFFSEEYEDCHVDKWTHEGSTWAVSEKQAVNNIHFRTGYPFCDVLGDCLGEGHVDFELKAVEG